MKKLFAILFATALTLPMFAQYGRIYPGRPTRPMPPTRSYHYDNYYGLRLGAGFTTVNSDDSRLDGGTSKAGLNLGFAAGFQIVPSSPLYFETGLYYTEKGGKGSLGGQSFTYGMNYLEVPLLMKYQYNMTPRTSIQPFFGVYGAIGVSGEIKDFQQHRADSSFSDDAFKRLDGGLRLGCGLQHDFLYAEIGYDIGLANVSRDNFNTAHTGCLFANIGVNF